MHSFIRRSSLANIRSFGRVLAVAALAAVALLASAPDAHAAIGVCDTAGPVEVEATAGPDLGPTAYGTLGAAFGAINAGTHQGAINVEICASTSEGATSATLNSSGAGLASYTSVLIRPVADGVTVDGTPAQGFGVIQLNGADNVTIDGDNPGSGGINRNLTVSNSVAAATTFGSAIRVATSATAPFDSNNSLTIKNVIALGNVTGGNASGTTATTTSANNSFGIVVGPNGGAAVTALASVTTGTAAGVTVNGLLIDNNSVNRAGRGIAFLGGTSASSTGVTITNNAIGDTTTPTPATPPYTSPSTTIYVKGINVQGTAAVTISANTVTNVISYINLAHAAVELTSGIGAGTVSVANNTISNIVVNAVTTASFAAQGVANVSTTAGGGTYTISGNLITNVQNFSSASAQQPNGIVTNTGTAFTSGTIETNKVTLVYNRSTGTFGAQGISLNGGNNVTVRNNFVSDVNQVINGGASFNTQFGVVGIRAFVGTGHKIYHNSVNMFGTALGVGAANNLFAAFGIQTTGQTSCDVRNNIFANNMAFPAGTATSAHVSIFLPSSGAAAMLLTLNNNAYYTGSIAGVSGVAHVGTTYTAVPAGPATWAGLYTAANFNPGATSPNANFRAYTSTLGSATNDNASLASTAAAPFTTSTNLHINTGLANTPLESSGAAVGVATDIDNDVRPGPAGSTNGGATAPDLGADEFDGVPLLANDIQATAFIDPPNGGTKVENVAFSPQASFSNNGTATQTSVTVRYRILDNTLFEVYNQTASIASISPFQTVIVTFPGASLTAGTYTIKAASELVGDQAPANNEITGTLTVEAPLAGTYTVGSGGNFASLTNAGGAFDKINALGASANVTFSIISNLAGETGVVAMNQVSETGVGGYTYTIKPANPGTTITGDSTTASIRALIRINGADRVTIDGSTSGGSDQNLTITNNDLNTTSAVIHVSSGASGAQNDTVKNTIVVGSSSTAGTFIAVSFGGAAITSLGTDNDNNRVENCDIRKASFGIATQGASAANKDTGTVITRNLMNSTGTNSLGRGGIIASFEDGIQITRNTVGNIISTASVDVVGISLGGLIGFGNTTVAPVGSEVSNALVERNNIGIVRQTNTFSAAGILVTNATTGTNIIRNNFVSGVLANGTSPDFGVGIFVVESGTDSTTQIVHNSVSMTGTLTGANQHQYALAVNGANPLLDIRNNILVNTQSTGTTAVSYAIGLGSSAFTNLTSDFNDFYVGTTGTLFKVGRTVSITPTGGTDQTTLANWQSAPPTGTGKDAASLYADPLFVSTTDLHINLCVTSPVANAATPGLATDDFDGDLRSGTPDIGADEYTQATPCTDGNECTSDTCIPATGCAFPPVPNGTFCGDAGTDCIVQDTCVGGACQDNGFQANGFPCGSPADTDCDNPDSCNGLGSCLLNYELSGTSCSDGLGCTTSDACNGTGNCLGTPVICNDGSSCTNDACVEPSGSCSYTTNATCNINGTVRYYRDNVGPVEPSTKGVPDEDVSRSSTLEAADTATTDSNGDYGFLDEGGDVTLTPDPTRLMSDEDECHNSITSGDASMIAQGSIGLVTLTTNQRVAGDVSNNGTISSFDAALTAQKAVAVPCLTYIFPVRTATGSDWAFRPVSRSYTPLTGVGEDYSFLGILYGDVTGNWTAPVLFGQRDEKAQAPSLETTLAEAAPRIATPELLPEVAVSAQGASSGATLYLAGMPTRNQDGTWSVVFGLQRADGILGLDMSLHFDSEAIHVVGVTTSGIGSAWTSAGHENGSDYQIALFGVEALRGTGPFLKVTYSMTRPVDGLPFGIAAQANEGQIPISWTGVPRATAPEVDVNLE